MGSAGQKEEKAAVSGQVSPPFLRGAISAFILFHLIAITCWAAPTNFWLVVRVKDLVRPYMLWSGLFQSWDTFAPNPPNVNSYVKAVVVTQDLHIHVWAFPRMEELSYSERYRKERYRKFAEVMLQANNAAILPDVAKHIARSFKGHASPRRGYYWCNTRRISGLERMSRANRFPSHSPSMTITFSPRTSNDSA